MKKRIFSLLIAVVIALSAMPAWADSAEGSNGAIVQTETLSAYVDGYGNLYIPGNEQPINKTYADKIVEVDPYRVIFLSKTGESGAEQTALISLDLTKMTETTVSSDVRAACVIDSENLYYIEASSRTQLMCLNFDTGKTAVAYTSSEQMDNLYDTIEGLVVSFVDNAGAVVLNGTTGLYEAYDGDFPEKSVIIDDCQVYIANGSDLYALRSGSAIADLVDSNVYDFTVLNNTVYYLANSGSAVRLKSYNPTKMEWKVLTTPQVSLQNMITASTSHLFVLGTDNVIYSVSTVDGTFTQFATVEAPQLANDQKVNSYSIEAMAGQLNVYANIGSVSETPTFTFMEFTSDAVDSSDANRVLIKKHTLSDETSAWTLLEPAKPYSTLKRGSRGDAVSDIQQPLYDLGYYDYYIDGIFGWRTERAIRLLQSDLGLTVNGIADADLQKQILSGTLAKYDRYRALSRGNRGLRVQLMQQRLRDLGYLADAADGIFGPRTQQAVQLFQQENGLSVSESATRETLMALYNSNAASCSSYINLQLGDSGYRVRELNKRLKALYYLTGTAGDTYTKATAEAIKKFQSQAGLYITGNATPAVQQRLFSAYAPEYNGYILLVRGDDNNRVLNLQRRLKELGYYTLGLDGYFGKGTESAVKLFQQCAGLRPTGKATVETQKLLFSPCAPRYIAPTIISVPVISIDCYEKLASDGTYQLTDRCSANGIATLSWYALGDVDYYNITITDSNGTTYLSQNTTLNMTSVPISALTMDRVYTLTVTAYPLDHNSNHVTSAKLSFRRIETPVDPEPIGTITDLVTVIDPVNRMENEISYVRKGTLNFRWYALGDVDSYYVEIRDSKDNVIIHAATTDEEASLSTDKLSEGEVYSYVVYAIPTNGTIDDATMKTMHFALDSEQAPVPTLTAPNVTVEDAQANDSGVYIIEETGATFRWDSVENADQYYIEIRDSANALFTSETTTATGYVLNPSAMTRGVNYTLIVTAIPEGGTVQQGTSTSLTIQVRENKEIQTLAAPVLSIVGLEPSGDGIVYSDSASLTFQWTAVDGASAYNIVIRDSTGTAVKEATLMQQNITFEGTELTRGAVYTASVTALPEDELHAQGTPATLPFILRIAQADEAEDTPTAVSFDEEPTPVVDVGTPTIVLKTVESVDGSVTYIEPGTVEMSWSAEGTVSAYEVKLLDSDGSELSDVTTQNTGAQLATTSMTPGAVYTLRVTAIPEGGSAENGATAEIWFAVRAEQATEEPTVEPEITEAPTEEPAVTEEPAATEEPIATEVPETAQIGAPVIDIQPAISNDGSLVTVSSGMIQFTWTADGEVKGYRIDLLDGENVLQSADVENGAIGLDSSYLESGKVYTLRVTAIPSDSAASEQSAQVNFAVAAEEAVPEQTPEATEEPTSEPTEEPTAEPEEETVPTVAEITAPEISVNTVEYTDNGVAYVAEGYVSFNWFSEGSVASYYIELSDGNGVLAEQSMEDNTVSIQSSMMTPGTVYTFRVTAIPENGTEADGAASEIYFALPIPQATEAPIVEPEEEPTQEYNEVPEEQYEEEYEEEYIEETTPEPTEEPVSEPESIPSGNADDLIASLNWDSPIDAYSDYDHIVAIQNRLVEWGWLAQDSFQLGQLDDATCSAVWNLQDYINQNYGTALEMTDTETRTIGMDTLAYLTTMSTDMYIYNPSPIY